MDFALTEDQLRIQEIAKRLAKDFATRAAAHDRDASPPNENYAALREAGFFGLVIPKEFGGSGAGLLGWVIAAEEIAQGDASTALSFNMHVANIAATILDKKSPLGKAAKQRIADMIIKDGKLTADSVSEPGTTGLTPTTYACSTQAKRVPGGYVLNGKKAFCSMIESADFTLLFAHPEDEPNPEAGIGFWLPANSPGMRIERVWDTLGMRGTRSDNLVLENCFIPDEHVVEEFRVPSVGGWLINNEAIFNVPYTGVYLGLGWAALHFAVDNVKSRQPKGYRQPIAYHADVRRRIGIMASQLEAARWLLRYSAWLVDTRGQDPEILSTYFKSKYVVGEAVVAAARSALEMGGAHAIFKGSPIERIFRDSATATIQQPPSDLCLQVVSAHTLGLDPDLTPPYLDRMEEAAVARRATASAR
jgi:alkylation response protein AidB-like acyl-CoA dehydrogenase